MKLYLIQHAEAKAEAEDPKRDLTDEGIRTAKSVANQLAGRESVQATVIWHSGKTRAEHTAVILSDSFSADGAAERHSNLAPDDDASIVAKELEITDESTAIVGHLPYLSRLASFLLTGKSDEELIRFQYGCVLCLERDNGKWRIRWFLTPDMIP